MTLHKVEQNDNTQPETESKPHIINNDNDDNDDNDSDDDDEEEEESELDRMVRQLGPCAAAYWEMDRCREAHNYQWTKCQPEVRKLKKCFDTHEGGSQSAAVQRKRMAMMMMTARNRKSNGSSSSSSGSKSLREGTK